MCATDITVQLTDLVDFAYVPGVLLLLGSHLGYWQAVTLAEINGVPNAAALVAQVIPPPERVHLTRAVRLEAMPLRAARRLV